MSGSFRQGGYGPIAQNSAFPHVGSFTNSMAGSGSPRLGSPFLQNGVASSPRGIGRQSRHQSFRENNSDNSYNNSLSASNDRAINIKSNKSPNLQDEGSGPIPAASSLAGPSKPSGPGPIAPPLYGYLMGQLANVVKFGVWWVGFSPLILTLFDDSLVVGGARVAFNLSLLLLSPIAGAIAEKSPVRIILKWTNGLRGLIYAVILPLAYFLFSSNLIFSSSHSLSVAFLITFLGCVFLDGVTVAFSNVADIDSGGTNLVAAAYNIEIDDSLRNYFNSLHIGMFDGSMVVFTPLLAGIELIIANKILDGLSDESDLYKDLDIIIILSAMAIVFAITTLISLYYYSVYLTYDEDEDLEPEPQNSIDASYSASISQLTTDENNKINPDGKPPSACSSFMALLAHGARVCWKNKRVRYRVLFLALETALEDSVISLIVPLFAVQVLAPSDSTLSHVYGNLWVAAMVSVGKCGGVLASIYMNKKWDPSISAERTESMIYRPLFRNVLIGSVAILLVPLAFHLSIHDLVSSWLVATIGFIGVFLFFLFSTTCKIGFSTLMQAMAAEADASGRLFGFVASFVTGVDAALLMIFSVLFTSLDVELAMWIVCGFITFHGAVEFLVGPILVLHTERNGDLPLSESTKDPLLANPQ